jgi:quercetin dioxygenase-like cupin family protein
MTAGAVVRAADVPTETTPTGSRVRTLLDIAAAGQRGAAGQQAGGQHFIRRLADVPPRSQFSGTAGAAGELWFVIGGAGRLAVEDHPGLPLRQDRGLWIPPGARYRVDADGPADLRFDVVSLPAETSAPGGLASRPGADSSAPLARDLDDCEVEMTGDRRFRVLFGPGRGCSVATQFAGEIPPGRAPDHSHPYDELVLMLEGDGVLHLDGADHALTPGTCAHLPPGQLHCLENTGTAMMRVLGVFHPADSPAAKTHPAPP